MNPFFAHLIITEISRLNYCTIKTIESGSSNAIAIFNNYHSKNHKLLPRAFEKGYQPDIPS